MRLRILELISSRTQPWMETWSRCEVGSRDGETRNRGNKLRWARGPCREW